MACLKEEHCDPRGESKDLVALRRAMQTKEYDKAVISAESLIKQGFVNIEAHMLCSQAYAELGNADKAKFHHDVASGLIRSIFSSGDGKTKETAFEVIGTFEEYVVVRVLGFPPLPSSQSVLPGKPHSYDVLKVERPGTGEKTSIYFNIDAFYPMKGL